MRKEEMMNKEEDRVWCSVEVTVNLGNYENIKIATGLSRTLLPNEDEKKVRNKMMEQMIEEVIEQGEIVKDTMMPKRKNIG